MRNLVDGIFYRVTGGKSMEFYAEKNRSIPVRSCAGAKRVRRVHGPACFWRALVLPLFAAVFLAGCGSKNVDVADPFVASQNVLRSPVFLPDDDGKPLTAAEKAAFMSTGDFDRNLTTEELTDVLRHFKNLVHINRRTVEVTVSRANLHIDNIHKVLRENNIPSELAYLPFVESNFNSLALSPSGALGMWQFMPRTGRYYGLSQDSWIDERRNPLEATRSAANYLAKLNRDFNDWHLAVSAYNAGEGKIGRGLSATGAKTFFELRRRDASIADPKDKMSEENQQYLPRFLAVCKIMRNLKKLGFQPMQPVKVDLCEVEVKPGTDLLALSRAVGMDWEKFMRYNSGYLRYLSPPERTSSAYVPVHMQGAAVAFLSTSPGLPKDYANWRPYRVQAGDSAYSIARRQGITLASLQSANPKLGMIKPGQVLMVPPAGSKMQAAPTMLAAASAEPESGTSRKNTRQESAKAPAKELAKGSAKTSVVIAALEKSEKTVAKKSESKASTPVAVKTSTPTPAKAAPAVKASAPDKAAAPVAVAQSRSYTVQQGDTVWNIARKLQVKPHALLAMNNLDISVKLKPGVTLVVAR